MGIGNIMAARKNITWKKRKRKQYDISFNNEAVKKNKKIKNMANFTSHIAARVRGQKFRGRK